MSKGCGCQTGILRFFKPPYSKKFYVPCCIHDDDYDRGGSRKQADQDLFLNCMKTIIKEETSPWKILWLTMVSLFYYMSVRLFGYFYFNYDKNDLQNQKVL